MKVYGHSVASAASLANVFGYKKEKNGTQYNCYVNPSKIIKYISLEKTFLNKSCFRSNSKLKSAEVREINYFNFTVTITVDLYGCY